MIPAGLILSVSRAVNGSMAAAMPENRARYVAGLGLDPARLATCEQVHGKTVQEVHAPARFTATDGLVTRKPDLPLMIIGADCPLVCIYDPAGPAGPALAVVHAGWRGLAAGILTEAVRSLAPADPEKLHAFISPCAGPCCYEVGEEVAGQFPEEAVLRKSPGRNPHLNLHRAAELSLGIPVEPLGPACTICTETHYSYRRNGTAGRHALIAALRSR